MKIAIDTVTDSKEDILKAIRLLQSLVGHEGSHGSQASRSIFDSPSPSLFGDAPAQTQPEQGANPVAAFGNMFGDNAPAPQQSASELIEEAEEHPKVELY
jgi:hypothetical protein